MDLLTTILSKLQQLDRSTGTTHYVKFFDDGTGEIGEHVTDNYLLGFKSPEDALRQLEQYLTD